MGGRCKFLLRKLRVQINNLFLYFFKWNFCFACPQQQDGGLSILGGQRFVVEVLVEPPSFSQQSFQTVAVGGVLEVSFGHTHQHLNGAGCGQGYWQYSQ